MKWIRSIGCLLLLIHSAGSASAQESHEHGASCAPTDRSVECRTERLLMSTLATRGVAAAMAQLDSVAAANVDIRRIGHSYAHAIGLAAYRDEQTVGEVFSACTPVFQAGCYHGVIQSYFDDHRMRGGEVEAEMVDRLCTDLRGDPAARWTLFQCVHGLGHGLMMAADNRINVALSGCDYLEDPWEREGCYSAVFMENVVQANSRRGDLGRPPASPAAHDHSSHGGHMAGSEAFDPDDPLFPCTVLAPRYLNACYQMQTSAILNLNNFDVALAARACSQAPDDFRSTCFQSLGRDISAITVQDHERAIRLCEATPAAYRPFCTLGYAKNLVDLTARIEPGMAFCLRLADPESKRVCYSGMGEELWVLLAEPAERAQVCRSGEAAYVSACFEGAGVVEDAD